MAKDKKLGPDEVAAQISPPGRLPDICEKCLSPSACMAGGCRVENLARNIWLSDNAEKILEVLEIAEDGICIKAAFGTPAYPHEDRDRARVEAIHEIVGRFRVLVERQAVLAPVLIPLEDPGYDPDKYTDRIPDYRMPDLFPAPSAGFAEAGEDALSLVRDIDLEARAELMAAPYGKIVPFDGEDIYAGAAEAIARRFALRPVQVQWADPDLAALGRPIVKEREVSISRRSWYPDFSKAPKVVKVRMWGGRALFGVLILGIAAACVYSLIHE